MSRPLVESKGPLRRVVSREQETISTLNDATRLVDVLECGHREGSNSSWSNKRRCRGCRDGDPVSRGVVPKATRPHRCPNGPACRNDPCAWVRVTRSDIETLRPRNDPVVRDAVAEAADLRARLSRAREALAAIDAAAKEGERAQARLPWYGPASSEEYDAAVEAGDRALAALRAALSEPPAGS